MPTQSGNGSSSNGHGSNGTPTSYSKFEVWRNTNVINQRQLGFVAAVIKLPSGDITSEQMLGLADLADTYANGNIRTTIDQNIIIRWIPDFRLQDFYGKVASLGLGTPGADRVEDIVACPGTDTCGLGITSSKGLARSLAELFPSGKTPDDLKGVNIKISGCHNSCAQHHIATIGLHGVGKRIGEHIAPVYELHLGGQVNGTAKIAQLIVKVPAKNVPEAIQHLLNIYRRDRQEGESLQSFITKMGKLKLKEELIPYTFLPTFEEDPQVLLRLGSR